MPTTLPDAAARARDQRRPMLSELVPIAVAIFYLLLVACTVAGLATDASVLFAPDQRPDRYNPMEPVGHSADATPVRGLAPR